MTQEGTEYIQYVTSDVVMPMFILLIFILKHGIFLYFFIPWNRLIFTHRLFNHLKHTIAIENAAMEQMFVVTYHTLILFIFPH